MNYLGLLLGMLFCVGMNEPVEERRCFDLQLVQVMEPDWDADRNATAVDIRIRNNSAQASAPTPIRLRDLDPNKKMLRKMQLEFRFKRYMLDNMERNITDKYVETIGTIPKILGGEEITLTLYFQDHWIYDPDCEIEAEIDFEGVSAECKRSNNWGFFASSE
ncbi:MAG: hypothetical protein AAFV80_09445 [Bacteroidota bacterium]